MKTRYAIWKGLLACAVLMALVTTAYAVSEADVVRLKEMVANGQILVGQDKILAMEAEERFGSKILEDQGRGESPRRPNSPLDDYQFAVVDYEWIDVLANAQPTNLAADDDNQGPFNIGFSFPFFGQTYTQFRVCSNGWMSFTSTSGAYFEGTIPSTVEPNNAIYVFWDDMYLPFNPDDADSIYYFADVANERLVVTWDSVSHIGVQAEKYSYQIVLTSDGNIRFNYRYVSDGVDYGNETCTVGIENAAGDEALQVCFDGTGTLPVSGMSILISQPPGVPVAPTNLVANLDGGITTLTWTDPTVDTEGSPVTIDHLEVSVNGVLRTELAPGVQTYTDNTPPIGNVTYSVRACAEVFCGAAAEATVFNGPFEVIDYDWVDILDTGTDTGLENDDQNAGPFDLGFTFTFFGQDFTSIRICSNGWVSFTSESATYANTPLPNPEEPNNVIYAFWDDMYLPLGGQVLYQQEVGRFIVSWIDVPHINDEATVYSYQVVIYDYGQIDINYNTISTNPPGNTNCTVGIENSDGTEALPIYVNGAGVFAPVSESSISFFNVPPLWGPLSGTVTLDGGAGNVAQTLVRANGPGNRTTNPNGAGAYAFDSVAVGNRAITASLAGYHNTTVPALNHDEEGTTGINLTLVRLDPPVPTNLIGSAENGTGLVTLDWDNSTDPLVDVYPVYRRLQGEVDWVLQGSPAASAFTQTLTAVGIYEYAVSARDNNVSTPVESELSGEITVLYGALPPTGLTAEGDYDDRIVLSWFEPGTPPEFEIYYDSVDVDPTCVEDGLGFNGQFPFGWFAGHYQGNGPITINRVKTRHWPNSAPGCVVQMGVFEDDGNGQPSLTPLGVTDWTIEDPANSWQDVELTTPVTVASGSFFVGIRQVTAQRVDIGMDFCAEEQPNTFFAVTETAGPWTELGSVGFPQVLCMRAFVIGDISTGLMELSPSPVGQYSKIESQETAREVDFISTNSGMVAENNKTASVAKGKDAKKAEPAITQVSFAPRQTQKFNSMSRPVSRVISNRESASTREPGRSLDEVLYYIVYRDNVDIAHPVTETYTDLGRTENIVYQYTVLAHYDDGQNSVRDTVNARCNMAPGVPTGLAANPLGTTQMVLGWVAPTQNADATPLVDLAGYRVFRNGVQIGTTAAGVTTYTDTPPDNQTFYTWTVSAVDEVPNVSGQSAGAIAAVVSPWEVHDYDWVDISAIGTDADITSDDDNAGPFELGFEVNFYGQTYNSVYMCSNGWASFTSTAATYFNTTLPNAEEPNTVMYCYWDDMYPPSGGQYKYYQDPANDRFILSWIDVPHITNDLARYTYQIIIYADGGIIYNYNSLPTEAPGITTSTIGVENSTGTEAIEVYFDGTGAFTPANQTSIAFWAGPSGAIAGLVREFGTNLPVTNAEVWVEEINEFTVTDAAGNYSISVEPGTYTLRAHKQGYCDLSSLNVVVDDGGTTTRNFSMLQPNATFSASSLNIFATIGEDGATALEITNPGATCEVGYSITTNQTWLTVNPASGDVAANESQIIIVSADVSGFAIGDYDATITVNHNDTGSPYEIPVTVTVSLDANDNAEIPTAFALHANYPNPFNASTSLNFDVPTESRVQITIYNVQGQEVARPVDSILPAGSHRVIYSASDLPTGMYLVKMSAADFNAVQKIVLLK